MVTFVVLFQLEFSDDVVKIIQAAINADGGQPENKKANGMVKSFFIRVSGIMGLNTSLFVGIVLLAQLLTKPFSIVLTQQMERVFPWFKVKESRFWETRKGSK